MLIELAPAQYASVFIERAARQPGLEENANTLIRGLTFAWFPSLSGAEIAVLMYLAAITIGRGQPAREVTIEEIQTGSKGRETVWRDAGTGLSRRSIQDSLRSLWTKDMIHAYTARAGNGQEHGSKIFEINFKKLVEGSKEKGKGVQTLHPTVLTTYGSKEIDVEAVNSFFLAASGESQVNGGSMVFVGKKREPVKRAEPKRFDRAADAVASVTKHYQQKTERRLTAASAKPAAVVSREELQAIFDKHSSAIGLGYRLMVTVKEYGFLKKRLAENGPADLSDFIRWTLTYWPTLAKQNASAVRKDKDRLVAAKKLPEAQHFNTFAYWYPYFFRAYQNHQAGQQAVQLVDQALDSGKDKQIKALQHALTDSRRQTAALRGRMQSNKSPVPPSPTSAAQSPGLTAARRRILPARTTDEDLGAPTELPVWE